MMDSKFKGPKWVGNIYQRFEAICHEVDEIVKQDTIKYVENQMHSVGKNVKKLCSDLLPLGHPVNEDVAVENSATVSTTIRKSLQENSDDASEKKSPTEPIIIDPVPSQSSLVSREHQLKHQHNSLTSVNTLEELDNLHIRKVDEVMEYENSAADNGEIAKSILSKLTSSGGEEHFAESSSGEFVPSNRENGQADFSEVKASTDELDFGSEKKLKRDNFSVKVECVSGHSGVSTVMVSTTEPKVMDPGNQLSLVSGQYNHLEKLSSSTSMDTLKGMESNLCMRKTHGTLTDEDSDANNKDFSIKSNPPVLPESSSHGVVEHCMMSPIGVLDQSNDANRHTVFSKNGPKTSEHELEFESLQNWTLWDDYVEKIECVSDALNSTSEMSCSVVSVGNTIEDAGLASYSISNGQESHRISKSSLEKLTHEAMIYLNSAEGAGFVSKFSDGAHETSAHSLECKLDSSAWDDDFADETEFDSAGSSTTSEMVYSVVSGEDSIENIGVTSLEISNAKPLGLSEDSSQKLYGKASLSHKSFDVTGCVCDMSEVIHDTAAHGLEFEFQRSSLAWDELTADNQCASGPSKATAGKACSLVSGENAAVEIGVPSFSGSNAKKIPRFTENSPQIFSEEATFCHSSGGKAGYVSDSSDGSSLLAPALILSSKNKDTEGRLSSFSSVPSVAEGFSRIMETMPLTVPCGKQEVKICESFQHEAAITSSDTGSAMENQPQVHVEVEIEQLHPHSTATVQPASVHAPEITEVVETPPVADLKPASVHVTEITEVVETPSVADLRTELLETMELLSLRSRDIASILAQIAQLSGNANQETTTPVKKESNWLEGQRGMLMGVATGIATVMLGLVASPPGGVWGRIASNDNAVCTASKPCISGTAVASYVQPALYQEFVKYVTLCFVFAISSVFLLLCGFHFHKRVLAWIYTVFMCLTLCFMSITYYKAIQLVDSSSAISYSSVDIRSYYGGILTLVWIPLLGLIVFLVALGNRVYKARKPAP